ncbi:probable magnesium transporter NIPA9 isoform X2 [Primulina huaijiensis]|uniref:probable magnesium transporter NIPA9 isoform X2 n=1 Tax=Primulina huaijiensis TaxID=1492673 RepID=UPI003CC74BCC
MWESVFLTVVATAGNNIGKVLQKKGTLILPPLSFKLKVIRTYVSNKPWVVGFLMDILGAFLMLLALSQAPVSVIQPISGCGFAILSVFSHFYLKEMMNAIDWIGITLAGIGTIGIGVGGEEQKASSISVFHLPWLAFVVAILFMQYEVIEEIIYGLESGSLFGIASVVSKMGFVFVEQEFSKLMLPICISIGIFCSASGFVVQTRGLKHGRAIVVSTCAAVASIVTGVLAGILVLGERLPSAPVARFLLLIGWLFIIIGVILLVTSTRLIRYLPRPRRSLARSGMEHNFGTRTWDTNPSAVIQASTLHHLLSPPSKSKA